MRKTDPRKKAPNADPATKKHVEFSKEKFKFKPAGGFWFQNQNRKFGPPNLLQYQKG